VTSERFENGLKVRKKVLGDEYVERSLGQANDFTMPFQELVTEYCWDNIWNRPGLPHKTRSLLNLAMLSALNRPNELRIHVRGALNNGCTVEEIQEVMLQVSVYCGVPSGLEGFKIAREVIDEQEK
jgi:4-carboxymuconolactone decarboxylase